MRRVGTGIVMLMTALTGATVSAAQSPADAMLLADLDAAIGADTVPEIVTAEDPVARELQTGLLEVARYVRDGDRDAVEQALFRFNQSTLRRPEWGWPEYAMAHTLLLLHDFGAPQLKSLGAIPGEGYLPAMERHLAEALTRDPSLGRARRLFVDLLFPVGARWLPPRTARLLEGEVSRPDALPGALLAWARHKRNTGSDRIVPVILDRAEAAGIDPSVVALERARALAALGDAEGAASVYWAGIGLLSWSGRELYQQDLASILDSDSYDDLAATPDSLVGAWLRRYWEERDAIAMEPPGGTLRRHLNDWVVAHRDFRVTEPWSRSATRGGILQISYWGDPCTGVAYDHAALLQLPRIPPLEGDLRAVEPVLNSGGALLLRKGRPTAILHAADSSGGAFAEALRKVLRTTRWRTLWLYSNEGGYDLFFFEKDPVANAASAPFAGQITTEAAAPAWQALARVLPHTFRGDDPERVDHAAMITCELGLTRPPTPPNQPADAAPMTGVAAIVDQWNAILDVRAFGHEGVDPPRLMLSYAFFIPRIHHPDPLLPSGVRTIRIRFEGYRLEDGARLSVDTTRTFFIAPALYEYGFLSGTMTVPAGAGTWLVAVRASPGDGPAASGTYLVRRGLEIGASTKLGMSDILAGHPSLAALTTPLGRFRLNLLSEWPDGTTMSLRVRLNGLTQGEAVTLTSEVIPVDQWPDPVLTRQVALHATGPSYDHSSTLDITPLPPGAYWLVMTAARGEEEVRRFLEFRITPR